MSSAPVSDIENQTTPDNTYIDLENVKITDENIALNVIIGYLNIAQKNGVFNFAQSAKIWECIKMFVKPLPSTATETTDESFASV